MGGDKHICSLILLKILEERFFFKSRKLMTLMDTYARKVVEYSMRFTVKEETVDGLTQYILWDKEYGRAIARFASKGEAYETLERAKQCE
jgi:hypothetical protein